jgi:hypothetical protein
MPTESRETKLYHRRIIMSSESTEQRIAKLEKLVDEQQKKINALEDIEAIRRLQYAYNYYVEHMLGKDVIDCFADSPDVKLNWLEGQWLGKEGVKRYFARAASGENPTGFSHQLMPTAGLITLNPDGKTARGRWYSFGGTFTSDKGKVEGGALVNGIYEMTYIKEDDVWKILQIYWFIPYSIRVQDWGVPEGLGELLVRSARDAEKGTAPEGMAFPEPDIPIDPNDLRYVSGFILPHHFNHPVTGKPSTFAKHNARLEPLKVD